MIRRMGVTSGGLCVHISLKPDDCAGKWSMQVADFQKES